MHRTLLKNATIVNEGHRFVGSVVIDDERIDQIIEGKDATPQVPVDFVIDAEGQYLLPGVIDAHVHFREPGLTEKGDMKTESRAAAAGGVTTWLDMPNTNPQTTSLEAYEAKMALAARHSPLNYGFFIGATKTNVQEVTKISIRRFAGIKVFMGASTGNMLVDDADALDYLFEHAKVPIVTHCEDSSIIAKNVKQYQDACQGSDSLNYHPLIRSEEACYKSTHRAVKLAQRYGTQLHVAHISTAKELSLFSPKKHPHITAEVCLPHLLFCDTDYARLGARIKCNPAVKTAEDRQALRRALSTEKIYTIATDHAPHRLKEKQGGALQAASGMPMVQFSLVSMLELMDEGVLTMERLVELMCHHPARLFRIENRGFIREGYKADLVLVRPNAPWTLTPNRIRSKCNWSPLEGHTFSWRVEKTFCNGFPIYSNGHLADEYLRGQAVTYLR